MSIRSNLSEALKNRKQELGYTYNDIIIGTSLSKSIIRYALNGGENVGLDTFQKLFDFMETEVEIHV